MARECRINDGGGRGVGKGESRQQLMLNAFTMEKKYIPLKLSSRFDNRNDVTSLRNLLSTLQYAVMQ